MIFLAAARQKMISGIWLPIGLMTVLLMVVGCGKQLSVQERQNRVLSSAQDVYAQCHEKYQHDITFLAMDEQPEAVKQKLSDLIDTKYYKKSFSDKWRAALGGVDLSGEKIPFHYYFDELTYDIKKLKNEYRLLTKFKLSTTAINQLADQIQDLRDQLLTISSYVKTHREYREEARYYEIANRVR